jgi:adenine-specific DNA-methyltransferase
MYNAHAQMHTPVTSQTEHSERWRTDADAPTRHELGQFITPKHVADFMASVFSIEDSDIRLLDAGAGAGALTSAFVRRFINESRKPSRISVTAYEIDDRIIGRLRQTMDQCQVACETAGIEFVQEVRREDFLDAAAASLRGDLFSTRLPSFNAAILNPPYRKLRSDSAARLVLRSVGIETSNFYTAFVALIIKLLAKKGELVAITPRSFCNGPYFKPFRDLLLDSMSLRRLHLFDSRSAAFGKDNVLQENLIFHAVKGEKQKDRVIVSHSSGHVSAKVTESSVPYSEVIAPNDPERFIHVDVGANGDRPATFMNGFKATLADLDISVSTGRVVDFRSKDFLRKLPEQDTAPLIYPCHFESGVVAWPKNDSKKPNAIVIHEKTIDLLVPRGVYVLVKRFSSKEERRRIVACIYDPAKVPAKRVAFENHLNYFHISGHGLSMTLAKGLAAFLNSTFVDSYFRRFSGHTQVNAADLRKLNYPTRSELERLGSKSEFAMTQRELDQLLEMELS